MRLDRRIREYLERSDPRSGDDHGARGLSRVLRRSRRISIRQARLSANARRLPGLRRTSRPRIGCGIGTDLVRFARGGAAVVGVDLSETAGRLARTNLALHSSSPGGIVVGNGAALPLPDESVDVATRTAFSSTQPIRAPSSRNRSGCCGRGNGDLHGIRPPFVVDGAVTRHESGAGARGAPGLRLYSAGEFRISRAAFQETTIVPERFPVRSRLHHGWKGALYNGLFVGAFNARAASARPAARLASDGVLCEDVIRGQSPISQKGDCPLFLA